MATSGRMNGSSRSIGGYGGNYYFIDWSLASQSVSGNYSTINWHAYFHFQNADAQLDNGNANLNGSRWSNGGRVYNYAGNFTTRNLSIASGSFNVGHDADGNRNLSVSGAIAVYQSGTSSGSASWSLPHINRYAAISSFNVQNATGTTFDAYVATDKTCDYLQYSLNGGGWVTVTTSNFTSKTFTISGLTAGTTYSLKVKVRYDTTGLWTTSSTKSITTKAYPGVTTLTATNVTDSGAKINVATNVSVNKLEYQINSGTWILVTTTPFTSTNFTLSALTPNTVFSLAIRVTNADGGLVTTSAPISFKTLKYEITSYSVGNPTTTTADVTVATNYLSNQFQWQEAGGGWSTLSSDDASTYTKTITGLATGSNHNLELRTRHKASGAYSDSVFVSVFTGYPTPTKSTNLTPGNGIAISTVTPDLSWTYNVSDNTPQSAYQVQIIKQSDGSSVWDTTKTADTRTDVDVPASTLVFNELYQWRVKTWSEQDFEGPWSDYALFKTSQAPVATITAPIDLSTVTTDAPLVQWSYSDAESTVQTAYEVVIQEIQNTGDTSGTVVVDYLGTGNDTSYLAPLNSLVNGNLYIISVYVTDGDGVVSDPDTVEVSVSFVQPPVPIIDVQLSVDKLFTQINITPTLPGDDSYNSTDLFVYKREVGELEWRQIDTLPVTSLIIDDFNNLTGRSSSGMATSLTRVDNRREGSKALQVKSTGTGIGAITSASTINSFYGHDTSWVWIYTVDRNKINSIRYKLGLDSSNYYYFDINGTDLEDGVWKSIERTVDQFGAIGAPSMANIAWQQIEIDFAGQISDDGGLIFDVWRFVPTYGSLIAYDYELGNHKTYEYSVKSYNSEQILTSVRAISMPVLVEYEKLKNGYLIPVGNEIEGLVGWVDMTTAPGWTTHTDTAYYSPKGAKYPLAYTLANQKYRTGQSTITFLKDCGPLQGLGRQGVNYIENIMNYKPLMFRQPLGDVFYVSIDGEISTEYKPNIGWVVSFNWTEIGAFVS